MKKILLSLVLIISLVSAIWFLSASNTKQIQNEPKMLSATPFAQIENKIGKEPMMLEFGATSCKSCIVMGKMLYEIKQKYPKSNIYFIEVYENAKIARKFGIRMIPTQKLLDKSGNVVETHMGTIEREELERKLKKLGVL